MDSSVVGPGSEGANDQHHRLHLESTLAGWWRELLGEQHIGLHGDFFQLGGRPEHGTNLVTRIKQEWGVFVRTAELYEARTISKLADLIQLRQSSREQLCIVPIRAEGSRLPLFLVHGVGGNILGFAGLARSLHPDQPVYGIQAQALNSEIPTLIRLEAMAAYYVEELRRVQPVGPYAFLGFSFGGLVAYEIAQQLTRSGEQVRFLGMLDTWQPGHLKLVERVTQSWLRRKWNRLNLVRLNTKKLSLWQLVPYLCGRLKSRFLRIAFGRMSRTGAVSLPESMRQVRDINLTAAARYSVQRYPGDIILFRAESHAGLPLPDDLNWGGFAMGGVKIVHLPGDHGQILAEPNLSFMTSRLDEYMSKAVTVDSVREEFQLDEEGLVDMQAQAELQSRLPLPVWMSNEASIGFNPGVSHIAAGQRVME